MENNQQILVLVPVPCIDISSIDIHCTDIMHPNTFIPCTDVPVTHRVKTDTCVPDVMIPDTYVPDILIPDTYIPDILIPDTYIPDNFDQKTINLCSGAHWSQNRYQHITNFYNYVDEKYGHLRPKIMDGKEHEWGAFPELFRKITTHQLDMINKILEKAEDELSNDEKKLRTLWEITKKRNDCDPISRELEILDAYLIPGMHIFDINDLVHRITEYIHYQYRNGIDPRLVSIDQFLLTHNNNNNNNQSVIGLRLDSSLVIPRCHKGATFEDHLKKIQKIINENTTTYLDDTFVQNIIEFESEIEHIDPNPINDNIVNCFLEKMSELFGCNVSDISIGSESLKKIMSIIFDPMNTPKYISYMQYYAIKKYAHTCFEPIDNQFFEFYNPGINKNRQLDLKSLEIMNRYLGDVMTKIYIDKNYDPDDKNTICMMMNPRLCEHSHGKILRVPGITEKLCENEMVVNRSHTLYDVEKLLQNSEIIHAINVFQNDNEYIVTAPLFQIPYYARVKNDIDHGINFGGIGVFIAFITSEAEVDFPDTERDKIASLLKKYLHQYQMIILETHDLLSLIKDVARMIRALNHSIKSLKQIMVSCKKVLKRDEIEYNKLFFESFAHAHGCNTRKYEINNHVIKLTGEFWVNLVNNLDEFYDTYEMIDSEFFIPCDQRIRL